jgi:hypothetical protein
MKRSVSIPGRTIFGGIAPIPAVFLLSGLLLGYPAASVAQTWTGAFSSSWADKNNWSDLVVPNSTSARVTINGTFGILPFVEIVGLKPTIGDLALGEPNTLSVTNGQTLTIAGGTGFGRVSLGGKLYLSSTGAKTDLILGGTGHSDITLSGGDTLELSNNASNRIYSRAGNTLVNSAGATIQGSGQLGIGGGGHAFILNNAGTIKANQPVPLTINTGTATTNSGRLEATTGGVLNLLGSYNAGAKAATGTILADKSSTVNIGGAVNQSTLTSQDGGVTNVAGGSLTNSTLTTRNGGAMYVGGGSLTNVTISAGSTATVPGGTTLGLGAGTLTLASAGTTLARLNIGSVSPNNQIVVGGKVTLGGNVTLGGGGQLGMTVGGTNIITSAAGKNFTLTNAAGNGVLGTGNIGNGHMSFVSKGYLVAGSGRNSALTIDPGPGNVVTNGGLFQAPVGSRLIVTGRMTNFTAPTTLVGGSYQLLGGTMQLPGSVQTNAATILMAGVGESAPHLLNAGGGNALATFTTNASAGSFTVQDTSVTTNPTKVEFQNRGVMTIGPAGTFTVAGANTYTQIGRTSITSLLDRTSSLAAASKGFVTLIGGTLDGFGTVDGNLNNVGGVVHPGNAQANPGILTVVDSYSQGQGQFLVDLAGADPGGYSQLKVDGPVDLGGTLKIRLPHINGFEPSDKEVFVILTSTGLRRKFDDVIQPGGNVTFSVLYDPPKYPNDVVLMAAVAGRGSTPEPASLVLLSIGLAAVGILARHRGARRRSVPRPLTTDDH